EAYQHLYGLSDEDLAKHGVIRMQADSKPGFPDRIEMRDVELGEFVLLLNHVSQPASTPYHASHAIFIREGAMKNYDQTNTIPEVMRTRLLSLRSFDDAGMMLDADVATGEEITPLIERLFS